MGKHFETATIGARDARALIELGRLHGGISDVEKRAVVKGDFFGEYEEESFVAVFGDGTVTPIPYYCGDSLERLHRVASLSWREAEDWPDALSGEEGRDQNGAVL